MFKLTSLLVTFKFCPSIVYDTSSIVTFFLFFKEIPIFSFWWNSDLLPDNWISKKSDVAVLPLPHAVKSNVIKVNVMIKNVFITL